MRIADGMAVVVEIRLNWKCIILNKVALRGMVLWSSKDGPPIWIS